MANLDQAHVYRLENNLINPTFETIERYCAALGIPFWQVALYAEKIKDYEKDYNININDFESWGYVADSSSEKN